MPFAALAVNPADGGIELLTAPGAGGKLAFVYKTEKPMSRLLLTAATFALMTGAAQADYTLHILHTNDLHSRIEVRVAKGRYGGAEAGGDGEADGRLLLWIRPRDGVAIDAGMLAIMADFIPGAVGNALGLNAGGNSLDNTIRYRRIVATEWVLCDIRITGVHGGFGHGAMYLFAQDGELMATASQSLIVRVRD